MSDIHSLTLHLGSGIAGRKGQVGADGPGRALEADHNTLLQSFENGF